MTVYVDQFPEGWGKWTGGGHMLTTDIDELHAMAEAIGLKREWFQDKTFPHYDVQRKKRELAVEQGAVEIELGNTPDDVLMRVPARGRRKGYETKGKRLARRRS